MNILDPGHFYSIQSYDGGEEQYIVFMKRIGDKYPGNTGESNSGTNCQELIRVLINRCKYLNNQILCSETIEIIQTLRISLELFEDCALRRKGLPPIIWPLEIENLLPCHTCGHIYPHTC